MRSLELEELSPPLLTHMLQSPGEPIEVRVQGKRLGVLTFDAAADDPAIDLTRSPQLQQILDDARADYRKHGGISLQEIRDQLAATEPPVTVSGESEE